MGGTARVGDQPTAATTLLTVTPSGGALEPLRGPGGVGFAWVGLALFYYLMNLIVRSPKFRWMGHATLLLTTGYLLMVGTSRLEPVYRVLSFLVLGTVLLGVSLLFTRLHRRPRSAPGS